MQLATAGGDWPGPVGVAEDPGADTVLHVDVEGVGKITARTGGDVRVDHGDRVYHTPVPDRVHRFDAEGRARR